MKLSLIIVGISNNLFHPKQYLSVINLWVEGEGGISDSVFLQQFLRFLLSGFDDMIFLWLSMHSAKRIFIQNYF